jgi:hypothetical protein
MKIKMYAGVIAAIAFVASPASFLTAQTFTITGRTPDLSQNLNVDETQVII